jgi:hypothetical protein
MAPDGIVHARVWTNLPAVEVGSKDVDPFMYGETDHDVAIRRRTIDPD